jgi:cytochrome c oxidase cbb3-type subunit 3
MVRMLPRLRSRYVLVPVVAVLSAACLAAWPLQAAQPNFQHKSVTAASTGGKQTFTATCAGCHGLDGRGGERAPNIAERASVQRLSDAQLSHIIENGVPGTGMPPSHALSISDVKAVVTYLRTLQGGKSPLKLPGDPNRGEALFSGKAGCSGCHMVAGRGGFIASDLSAYAGTHTVEQMQNAISSPTLSGDRQVRLVTATLRSGEKVAGRIRNEDNFSVQLQTLDGAFRSLARSELERLEYDSQPLMPSDYSSTLSASELNDLISYLMRVAGGPGTDTKSREWEDE